MLLGRTAQEKDLYPFLSMVKGRKLRQTIMSDLTGLQIGHVCRVS